MNILDLVEYRDGALYWTANPAQNKPLKGKEAGNVVGNGYKSIQYKRKRYQVHRLIWELHYGEIPEGMTVDHINRDKLDNRIENLRVASYSLNNSNRAGYSSTGIKYIYKETNGKYKVQTPNKYYGTYDDLELAELIAGEIK